MLCYSSIHPNMHSCTKIDTQLSVSNRLMSSRKALSIIGFPWVAIVESKFSHRCKCGFATYRNYYYYCKYFPQFHLPLEECDDNVFEIAGFLGINTFPKPIFVTSVVFAQVVVVQPAVVINYLQLWTSVTWVPWAPAWVDEWGGCRE